MTPERLNPDDVQSEHMTDPTSPDKGTTQVAVAEKPSTLTSEHQKPIFEPQFATRAKGSELRQIISSGETITPDQIDNIREYVMDCALDHILAESKDSGYRPLITRATIDHALRETQDATLRQLGLKPGTEQYASVKLRTNSSTVITNPETLFADKSYFEKLIADTNREIERLSELIARPDNEKPKNNTWVQQKNEAIKLKESLEEKLRTVILQIKTHDQDGINQAIQDLQTYHQWITRGQLRALLFGESTDGQPLSVVLITTHFDDGASITKAFNRGAIDSKTATLWYNRLNRVIASYNNTRFSFDQFSVTNEELYQAAKIRDILFAMYKLDVQRNQTQNKNDREMLDVEISALADSLSTLDWETYQENLEQGRFYAAFENAKDFFFKLAEKNGAYILSHTEDSNITEENEDIANMMIQTLKSIRSAELRNKVKEHPLIVTSDVTQTVELLRFAFLHPIIQIPDLLLLCNSLPQDQLKQINVTEIHSLMLARLETTDLSKLTSGEFVQLCQLYHFVISRTALSAETKTTHQLARVLANLAEQEKDPKALQVINSLRCLYHTLHEDDGDYDTVTTQTKTMIAGLKQGSIGKKVYREYQDLLAAITPQKQQLLGDILSNEEIQGDISSDHVRFLLLKFHQSDLTEDTARRLFEEQVSEILSQLAADEPDKEKVKNDLYDFYYKVINNQWKDVGYQVLCSKVDHKRWVTTDRMLGEMLANLALGRQNPTNETHPFYPRIHQDILRINGEQLQKYAQGDEIVFTIPKPAVASTQEFSFPHQAKRTIPSARLALAFTELMRLKEERVTQLSLSATVIRDARSYPVTLIEGLRLRTEKPDEYQLLINPKNARADQQHPEDITRQTELRKAIALELLLTGENLTEYAQIYQQLSSDEKGEFHRVALRVFHDTSALDSAPYKLKLANIIIFVHGQNEAIVTWIQTHTQKDITQLRAELYTQVNQRVSTTFLEDLPAKIDGLDIEGVGTSNNVTTFIEGLFQERIDRISNMRRARDFMRETVFAKLVGAMVLDEFNQQKQDFTTGKITFTQLLSQVRFFESMLDNISSSLFARPTSRYVSIEDSFTQMSTKAAETGQKRIVFLACFTRDLLDYSQETGNNNFERKKLVIQEYIKRSRDFGIDFSELLHIYNYLALHADRCAKLLSEFGGDNSVGSYQLDDFRNFIPNATDGGSFPVSQYDVTTSGYTISFGNPAVASYPRGDHYLYQLEIRNPTSDTRQRPEFLAHAEKDNTEWFGQAFSAIDRVVEIQKQLTILIETSQEDPLSVRYDSLQIRSAMRDQDKITGQTLGLFNKDLRPRVEQVKRSIEKQDKLERINQLISDQLTDPKFIEAQIKAFLSHYLRTENGQLILAQPAIQEEKRNYETARVVVMGENKTQAVNWSTQDIAKSNFLQGLYSQFVLEMKGELSPLVALVQNYNKTHSLSYQQIDLSPVLRSYLQAFDYQLRAQLKTMFTKELGLAFPQDEGVTNSVRRFDLNAGTDLVTTALNKQLTTLGNQAKRQLYGQGK